jgi:hypothetical protein
MSKDKHIDNISEKVWNAYFSGFILTSEKERVEAFLGQYPEYEEEFNTISSSDAVSINKITKNVNSKIESKYSKRKYPVLWLGVVASIAVITLFVFNSQRNLESKVLSNNSNMQQEVVLVDSVAEQNSVIENEAENDTLFSFEMKSNQLQVVELPPVASVISGAVAMKDIRDVDDNDMKVYEVIIQDDMNEEIIVPYEVNKKSFVSNIAYRQTVHVEDNFHSPSKTAGKTSSYASPVIGYSYESEGMPNFNGSDEALLSYINSELSSDELINGIRRKMKASLSFVVTNKGKIKDVLVQNCNHRQFGMSLMELMENMPDWSPSDFKGKKGKAHYVLKIVFE